MKYICKKLKQMVFSVFMLSIINCLVLVEKVSAIPYSKKTVFDSNCSQRIMYIKPKKDLSQMTTHEMTLALSNYASEIILNFCKKPDANEHIPCLKNLLSDTSFDFNDIDKWILSYMKHNFESLRGVFIAYDQEKERCNKYYAYGGLGFCIRHTGRECWDNQGTIGRKTIIGEGGAFCEIEEFITPRGVIKERLIGGFACDFEPL